MKTSTENYKGFVIEKRIDVKSHTCIIYKDGNMVKGIAGDIFADGSENSIEKAKSWIDDNTEMANRVIDDLVYQKEKEQESYERNIDIEQ